MSAAKQHPTRVHVQGHTAVGATYNGHTNFDGGSGNYVAPPKSLGNLSSAADGAFQHSPNRSRSSSEHNEAATAATTTMNGKGGGGGGASSSKYADLPALLRACAAHVERDEFNPVLYQALGSLHQYAGENASKPPAPSRLEKGGGGASGGGDAVSGTPERGGAVKLTRQSSIESLPARMSGSYRGGGDNQAPTPSADMNGTHQRGEQHARSSSMISNDSKEQDPSVANQAGGGGGATTPHRMKFISKKLNKQVNKALHGVQAGVSKLSTTAAGTGAGGGSVGSSSGDQHGIHGFDDEGNEWCEEHFTMGCHCKKARQNQSRDSTSSAGSAGAGGIRPAGSSSDGSSIEQLAKATTAAQQQQQQQQQHAYQLQQQQQQQQRERELSQQQQQQQQQQAGGAGAGAAAGAAASDGRPCFQRPVNPRSNLIANGWVEQQRRSKMRVVWKDILASLVEGRRPGEETTLWIQRQVVTSAGKQELEALHQIPMKWIEEVTYLDFYGDHRFALKIYNVADEFQFRTKDEESAQSWVVTLKSAVEASMQGAKGGKRGGPAGGPSPSECGLNNLDDWDNAAATAGDAGTRGAQKKAGSPASDEQSSYSAGIATAASHDEASTTAGTANKRMTIRELRAIANGAGIDTRGMERADLERIAAKVQKPSSQSDSRSTRPSEVDSAGDDWKRQQQIAEQRAAEERRRRHVAEQQAAARQQHAAEQRSAEERRRQQLAEQQAAEERRRKQAAEQRAAEERRRQQMAEQQAAEERKRQQQLAEQRAAEERRRQHTAEQQAAEERRRQQQIAEQKAAEELRRRQQMAEQQAAEQKRRQQMAEQQAAEQRRRMAEQQAAEERKRQQHFQQQQQQQQQQQRQNWNQQQFPHQQQHNQQQQFFTGHQQRPTPQPPQQPFASDGAAPPPPQNGQSNGGSPINAKYAKAMADKSDDESQAAITAIKRNVLIHWALQPPMLNALRPIDQLICTIHKVFPPAFGVPAHDYFAKWKPFTQNDLILSAAMGNSASEEKLKKAVRKIRFFLHPDKLPKDLNSEQEFMCKMLWDVTSDAWEEFCTKNEELDWIRS